MKVQIRSTELIQKMSKKTGKPYYQQAAGLDVGDGFAQRIVVFPPSDGQGMPKAYAVGEYTLAPESFTVNEYGDIRVSPKLVPVSGARPVAARAS